MFHVVYSYPGKKIFGYMKNDRIGHYNIITFFILNITIFVSIFLLFHVNVFS